MFWALVIHIAMIGPHKKPVDLPVAGPHMLFANEQWCAAAAAALERRAGIKNKVECVRYRIVHGPDEEKF